MNRKFTWPPVQGDDTHVPLLDTDLTDLLCFEYERVLSNDYILRFENRLFQILKENRNPPRPGKAVTVRKVDVLGRPNVTFLLVVDSLWLVVLSKSFFYIIVISMTLTDFELWYQSKYRWTSSALTATAMILSDLLGVMLSFGVGFFLVNLYDFDAINFKSFVTYWPYLPVFILIFQLSGLYPGIFLAPSEELRHFTIGSLMAHGGIILSKYVEDQEFDAISVAFIISFFCSTLVLLICRAYMHRILSRTCLGDIPAVIYGGGKMGCMVVDRLLDSKKMGYVPVLILEPDPDLGEAYRNVPVMHDVSIGPEIVRRFNIKMAIVTSIPKLDPPALTHLLNYSISAFRYHVLIPDIFSITNIWMSVRDFDGILGFMTSHNLKMPWHLGIKRFMDISLSILLGLVLLPLLLFIALLVKLTSPGPVLYGHTRIGLNGRHFKVYKFRSMVVDAEKRLQALLASDPKAREEWATNHKIKNDPRVTKLGKFLRQTSLDEFPQLFNIIRGDMSLVGPRPIVDDEIAKYGEDFNRIFSVRPGLSGLWQISGRSDTDYSDRVSFDTYYLQSWSVWLDLWVLYRTVGVVLKGKGAY